MSIQDQINRISGAVSEQSGLISQIKSALAEKASGGGVQLPTLTNPGSASDLASGKQLIDANGKVVTGTVQEGEETVFSSAWENAYMDDGVFYATHTFDKDTIQRTGSSIKIVYGGDGFGNASPENVAMGKTFTSVHGLKLTGTATIGGGMVVKTGTTTSRTINTGLSDVEQFFLYKESQTATGLIHLHYTKTATSRMYASAWSTSNYGTKTITNGTGGVTVNGGSITISATQAAQGALSSGVTYKWVALGTE